jgi:hypothetical protein
MGCALIAEVVFAGDLPSPGIRNSPDFPGHGFPGPNFRRAAPRGRRWWPLGRLEIDRNQCPGSKGVEASGLVR